MLGASARTETKINNLQALRAFAALAVVIFHTGYIPPHLRAVGSFGVDIFFVLSGYIMARICEKNTDFFLRRRLIRILPPYWTLTLLLFVVALGDPALLGSTSPDPVELLKSLFFIPFFKSSGLLRPLLFVGWSLNYEMFFYLLLFFSLLLWKRRPLILASAVIVLLHYLALFLPPHHTPFIAFFRESFILDFPLGIAAYQVAKRVPAHLARQWRVVFLVAVFAEAVAFVLLQGIRPNWGYILGNGAYNGLSTAMVLTTSLLSQGGWDTRWKPIILLGDASYILYLVHPYCEYPLQRIVAPHLPVLRIDLPLGCVLAVSLSIAIAFALHLYAELPVLRVLNERYGGHRKSAEFRVVAEEKGEVKV